MLTTYTAATASILAQNFDFDPQPPTGGFGDKITELVGWVMWGCIIGSIVGIMICGSMLAYERITGGGGGASTKLVGGLVGAVVIGSASGLVQGLVLN
jgi:hypothetical protein